MRRPVGSTPQRTSVLCPVDFSSGSRAALRTAATLARARGATLDIVYVNDPLLVAAAAAAWNRASLGAASEQELARFVARVLGPGQRPGSPRVRAAARAIIAQILIFRNCRAVLERLHPGDTSTRRMHDRAQEVAEFSLAALDGLRAAPRPEPAP